MLGVAGHVQVGKARHILLELLLPLQLNKGTVFWKLLYHFETGTFFVYLFFFFFLSSFFRPFLWENAFKVEPKLFYSEEYSLPSAGDVENANDSPPLRVQDLASWKNRDAPYSVKVHTTA